MRTFLYNKYMKVFLMILINSQYVGNLVGANRIMNKNYVNNSESVKQIREVHSLFGPLDDDYVLEQQRQCFAAPSLLSCIKYRASKVIWKLAINSMDYFPKEYSRQLVDDKRRLRLIQLNKPSDIIAFGTARSLPGDNEQVNVVKFLKRAAQTFAQNHGLQLVLNSGSGLRVRTSEFEERGVRGKKGKLLVILPLIILLKIAVLKFTVVTLLLGVLGLNLLILAGTGWIIHYLKNKTLCKIHPTFVQEHHSHVYDQDPADYSQFVGSINPGSHHSTSSSTSNEIGNSHLTQDWLQDKAYRAYNYLDTISHRLQHK